MFKFLAISLIVCQGVYEISGETINGSTYDTQIPFISMDNVEVSDTAGVSENKVPDLGGIHISGTHQTFYINSRPQAWKWPTNLTNAGTEIRPDYTVTTRSEAHKVHRRTVSWNTARQICVEEGGHLADIRTKDELKDIKALMLENAVGLVWVGFHDHFQEGDWITVLDEPLAKMEWEPWTKSIATNPDNAGGNENCAVFLLNGDGINDDNCAKLFPFVCKMSVACN